MVYFLKTWIRLRIFVPRDGAGAMGTLLDRLGDYFDLEHRFLGHLGSYRHVRYRYAAEEHFVPDPDADPASQTPPDGVCIETWCSPGIEDAVVRAIQERHPYEHPVIEVSELRLAQPKAKGGKPSAKPTAEADEPVFVLPANQALAAKRKWPVVGERAPRSSEQPWTVTVKGEVEQPMAWSLTELQRMAQIDQMVNIHCVTRWSRPHTLFRGIPLRDLLALCRPKSSARFISFVARSERNHNTSLRLDTALALDTLIAFSCEGKDLEQKHGGPVRTVVPGRYFYKSLKWLETIELLEEDRLGYWEGETGYHNEADPWREQRYITGSAVNRNEAIKLFQNRDFSNRDLLNIDANRVDLEGLNARKALLRNAFFQKAKLQHSCFDEANLSNAHLEGADLRNASFVNADVEGADFRGTDLRGADFTGASLFGVTFCPEPGTEANWGEAIIDQETKISAEQIDRLSEVQQEFWRSAMEKPAHGTC